MSNQNKYRPSLSATQIDTIMTLAKRAIASPDLDAALSDSELMSVISTLAPFQAKILNSGISPAYKTQPARPKANSLESLGGEQAAKADISGLCKEAIWELAYEKSQSNPAACTLDELMDAKEHAYLNDLMSASEITQFEAEQFGRDTAIVLSDSASDTGSNCEEELTHG